MTMQWSYCEYRYFQKQKNIKIPIPTLSGHFINSCIVKSTQRKMENNFKGLLLSTPTETKTVSLNHPREKYPNCNQTPSQQPESEAI